MDQQTASYVGCLLVLTVSLATCTVPWHLINLPDEHVPYYFFRRPKLNDLCRKSPDCPYQKHVNEVRCWGYEKHCDLTNSMSQPLCSSDAPNLWARTREEQVKIFWQQADFGYVDERLQEMTMLCEPQKPTDSYLACAKYMRYCYARNIFLDFTKFNFHGSKDRFREDVFKPGEVGGHCKLYVDKLKMEGEHKSALQSWFAELQHYSALQFSPAADSAECHIIIDKPSILIKLDAGVSMYHHFCDFINIYASQHINGSFLTDVNIIMWDTSDLGYGDFFADTWKAFTDHPVIPLKNFNNKKVCIKNAMFSLLARMRYGLYYNMPLIPGCEGSSLLRAFSQHLLHRLSIAQDGPLEHRVRVTLLSRSTAYRRILNENELVSALKSVGSYEVRVVDYNSDYPFLQQLKSSHNSDIFIGVHGAGLTHLLFLPDWAVIFELYNCEDPNCYSDLARLRGVRYITWRNGDKVTAEDEGHHPTLGAHKKFTNYSFDVNEFMLLVNEAAEYVLSHPRFIEEQKRKRSSEPSSSRTSMKSDL